MGFHGRERAARKERAPGASLSDKEHQRDRSVDRLADPSAGRSEPTRGEPSPIALRPYQTECLQRIRERYKSGARRLLVSLPTGTGKTVVFASFPAYFGMKRRLLVLAHRAELLDQAAQKFCRANPRLRVEIEQAGRHASRDCDVVIASVPTLGRKGSARLAKLDPQDFYLIVVDEAHHAISTTYRRVFDHFDLFAPASRRLLVGFTATPYRGDRKGLGEVFEEVAFERHLPEMIAQGFLCQISGWRVSTHTDLDKVSVRAGDFVAGQLAEAVNTGDRNALIIRSYCELARGRRGLVFCVDVEHAKQLALGFRESGIRAAAVWGAMAKSDRAATLERFSRGELDIITNCNVLTEGFDEPRVDCVIMARPTKSRLLYTQIIGRGTRLHPEKNDLVVVDVVDNTAKHSLVGLNQLFALPPALDLGGRRATEMAAQLRALEKDYPWVDQSLLRSPADIAMAAERVELFRFEPPAKVAPYSHFAWFSSGESFKLVLPRGERITLEPTLLDTWRIHRWTPGKGRGSLGDVPSLKAAIARADGFVRQERPDAVGLVDCEARWRTQRATDKQLSVLRNKGIPIPKGLSRGAASWMIAMSGQRARAEVS